MGDWDKAIYAGTALLSTRAPILLPNRFLRPFFGACFDLDIAMGNFLRGLLEPNELLLVIMVCLSGAQEGKSFILSLQTVTILTPFLCERSSSSELGALVD